MYPPWRDRPAYAATRLLHEGFHFHDPEHFGSTAMHRGFYNASRFQGFVSELTGLLYNRSVVRERGLD